MTVYPPEEPADRVEHVEVQQYPEGDRQTVVVENREFAQRAAGYRAVQIVWLLFGILEGLIVIRILLRLFGANPGSPFANFIYGVTGPFLAPFVGLFGDPGVGNMVLELSTIVGLIVYALLGWLLARIVWLLIYRPSARSVSTVDRDRM
jgi:uncharacterized protein YggT (Ycf19 family)